MPDDMRGHNGPPDPLDEALAPYGDAISEAENWLDGSPVENEAQMKAVDAILADIRRAKSDVDKAQKSATAPLHDAWKAEIARWKPTVDDLERLKKGLAKLVDGFKRKLAEKREAEERAARQEAERKRREAELAARQAQEADIEGQRAAAAAQAEAERAQAAVVAASKGKVKGLRTVTRYAIDDHRAALHDIAKNDRDAITAFVEDYVRRRHKDRAIDGVRVWQEREAY